MVQIPTVICHFENTREIRVKLTFIKSILTQSLERGTAKLGKTGKSNKTTKNNKRDQPLSSQGLILKAPLGRFGINRSPSIGWVLIGIAAAMFFYL